MIIKLLFFIGWVGMAVISLAGMLTSIIPKYAELVDFNSWTFRGGLFIICLFYFLLVIEKVTSIFIKDDKAYEFSTEKGLIKVSAISVNNLIKEIAENNKNIKKVKVKSSQGKKGLKISMDIEILTLPNLSKEYEHIQNVITANLKEKLNIDVDTINIHTSKLISNGNVNIKEAKTEQSQEEARGGNNE